MNRNGLYFLMGALAVLLTGLGVYAYREETKPKGIEIQLNDQGVSIDRN
jgi:hypothetical protein